MISIIAVIILLTAPGNNLAQSSRLKIGDDVPYLTLKNLINYKTDVEKLHSFKGKFVILYFWNEGCSASIQSWPKLQGLVEKFKNDIAIILVNDSQDKDDVQRIYKEQKQFRKVDVTLPTVCDDLTLLKYFPRNSVPHIIWIDRNMKLLSITREDQVNEANIVKLITQELVNMPVKDGVKYRVDFSKPLYIDGNGGNGDHLKFYSVLSNYYPGIYGSTHIDSTGGFISNSTVVTMLRYLFKSTTNRFGAQNFFPEARVWLDVRNPEKYKHKMNGRVPEENYFTYQFISREPLPPDRIRSYMLDDIKRYFGLDCYWSKEKKMCLVLTAPDTLRLAHKDGETAGGISHTHIEVNNITVQELIDNILAVTDYHHGPYPWVNETGFKGRLGNISVQCDVLNWEELNRSLRPFGLQLKLEEREVPVLVIYEVDYHQPAAGAVRAN